MRRRIVLALLVSIASVGTLFSQEEERSPPVSSQDVAILERAKELLPDEAHWNRRDDRNCLPDAKVLSLFCALQKASIEKLGTYDHRRAALQEVRFAIEEVSKGREFEDNKNMFTNFGQRFGP